MHLELNINYLISLCDSNPKLSYINLMKIGKYPFAGDFNVIIRPPKRAEGTADT